MLFQNQQKLSTAYINVRSVCLAYEVLCMFIMCSFLAWIIWFRNILQDSFKLKKAEALLSFRYDSHDKILIEFSTFLVDIRVCIRKAVSCMEYCIIILAIYEEDPLKKNLSSFLCASASSWDELFKRGILWNVPDWIKLFNLIAARPKLLLQEQCLSSEVL